jgi:UDP-N-acetyl-D-mannosaminuronic acid transferase (WecB/TagA/CpsF family)
MLDVLAGKTKMTPKWFKRRGLATLFRVAQEPRRLFIDRCKMLYFLLTNFFPLLFIKIVSKSKGFSIPEHYINRNTIG